MSASAPLKPTIRVPHRMQPKRGRLLAWWDAIRSRPAPNDEAHEEKLFTEKFLHPDYFYTHAEPHRRRPTLVEFPHFMTHTATYFGRTSNNRTEFRKWLQMLRGSRWRQVADVQPESDRDFDIEKWEQTKPISTDVLDNFSLIAQPSSQEEINEGGEERSKDVEFVLEFRHLDEPDVVVRIEAHLEFFTLTLFKPLGSDKFNLDTIYSDLGGHLVPDVDVRPNNQFHALYRQLVRRFPRETFAHFQGVVVSPEFFDESQSKPFFADPGNIGPVKSKDALLTAKFLRDQKDRFKRSVFNANDDDVVACYFQHGQAIYLSALGAQYGPGSKDALRYLVIYNNGDPYERRADRYRLSRLVHRINAIGTLRLAALRDLRELRRLGDQLRQIESEMEIAAHEEALGPRYHKLRHTISLLEDLTRSSISHGVPPLYRTARSGLYFNQMKKLLAELSADPISSWQSYEQFLSRRLFAQLEFSATLGARISALWANARTRAEVAKTLTLEGLTRGATIGSVILLPLAVAEMTRGHAPVRTVLRVVHQGVISLLSQVPQLDKIKDWLQQDMVSGWRSLGIQEFTLVFWITLCVWGTFIAWISRERKGAKLSSGARI